MTDDTSKALPGPDKESKTLSGVALVVAVGVLLAWVAMLWWLVIHTDAVEVQWARLLTVLSSLQAVAFAAAGALFGTTIQQQRVRDAHERAHTSEKQAEDARAQAAENAEAAANGKALAEAVKLSGRGRPIAEAVERVSGKAAEGEVRIEDLSALAAKLFPD
jgi:type VI protein secretion system component VasK